MKIHQLTIAFVAGCATMALAATALSRQDAMSPDDMQKMYMDAMERYGTPGPEHADLAKNVGQWNVTVKSWMDPSAPPMESAATANITMIMDGRFQFEQFKGDFGGMPFEGGGLAGFDRMSKKWKGVWVDNMSTSMMNMEGKMEDGHMTWYGKTPDVMTGTYQTMKMVEHKHSADHQTTHFYIVTPDGEETKTMELDYRRVE